MEVYASTSIKRLNIGFLDEILDKKFEILWLQIRPSRLPRGMSGIIISNVYHSQTNKGATDTDILNYLYEPMPTIEARIPNIGVLIVGDFNRLNICKFKNAFQLTQIVNFFTRGNRMLDLILTNMKCYFKDSIKRPGFGLSDHATIERQPQARCTRPKAKKCILSRDLKATKKIAMSSYLKKISIFESVMRGYSCEEKTKILEKIIITGLNTIMPFKRSQSQ